MQRALSASLHCIKAMKENDQHIEQLLLRGQRSQSPPAVKLEIVANQLASLTSKYARLMSESDETRKCMKSTIETLKAENASLSLQLDDEKRKVNDLQFAVEETGDLDTWTERDAKRMHELELQIHLENSCSKTLTD